MIDVKTIRKSPNNKKTLNTKQNINCKEEIESPSPIITDFYSTNKAKNRLIANQKKAISGILTLDNIIEAAYELSRGNKQLGLSICRFGKLRKTKLKKQRLRINPLYKEILNYIRDSEFSKLYFPEFPNWKNIFELYNRFPEVKQRTLRGYLKELQKLKWLRRHGRDYHLNPFLFELFRIDKRFTLLVEFAPFKLDLFELMNLPLVNAIERKIIEVDISFFEKNGDRYFRENFNGVVVIRLALENGTKAETVLPVNLHAQYAKGGDIKHYCVPLAWKLFDIEKASYYSTNYKRSHHKGVVSRKNEFIHFDNSITIRYLSKDRLYMLWEKKFHQQRTTSIKYWQTGEYLEYDNLDNLKQLFVERFVNGKRFLDLFNALGMTYKPNTGRPKDSKRKIKSKNFTPKQIDLKRLLEIELSQKGVNS